MYEYYLREFEADAGLVPGEIRPILCLTDVHISLIFLQIYSAKRVVVVNKFLDSKEQIRAVFLRLIITGDSSYFAASSLSVRAL